MKKIILSLLVLVCATGAFAQGPQRQPREFKPEDYAVRRADRIKNACATTDDQYQKIYDFYLAEAKAMQERMKQARQQPQQQPADMRAAREETQKREEAADAAIKAILTEEQIPAYDKMKQEQRQRMQQRQGGPRGPQNGQPGAQGHRHQSGPRGERPQF